MLDEPLLKGRTDRDAAVMHPPRAPSALVHFHMGLSRMLGMAVSGNFVQSILG